MDKLAELNHGAKVVLGSAIALLIVSFFNWFEVVGIGVGSMWNGIGILAGLLLIATIAWQVVRLANINLEIGVGPAMVTAVLALLTFIFVFIRWIAKPDGAGIVDVDWTIWAWIGLVLAIVMCAGAWANMKLAGESLGDIQKLGGSKGGDTPPPAAPTQTPPPPASGDDNPGA
jgi:hypothetical protein